MTRIESPFIRCFSLDIPVTTLVYHNRPTIDELEAMLERNGLLTRKPPEAFREEILRDHLRKYKKRYNTLPEFSGEKEQVELGMSRPSLFWALEMYLGREVKNEKAVSNIDTESDDFLTAIHSL